MNRLTLNSSYIFTTETQPIMPSMPQRRVCCHPVILCCGGALLAILITTLVLGTMEYYHGTFQKYNDMEKCVKISNNESFIPKIDDKSVTNGTEVLVNCKVVNFVPHQKVVWTGPDLDVEVGSDLEPKYHKKKQKHLNVIALNNDEDSFLCADFFRFNGTVTVRTFTFRLIIDTKQAQPGRYTCSTTYAVAQGDDEIKCFGNHATSAFFDLDIV